jgi:Uncharacterised nucleotidyltransferase
MRATATREVSPHSSNMPAARKLAPTAEWHALLEFAAPHSNRDQLARLLQNPLDWPQLLQLAHDHGLILLLADRMKNLDTSSIPPTSRLRLQELQRSLTVSSLQLTAELFRVLERFANSEIDVLLTKGPGLSARCYGDPGMRQYGDLDLIVRETDMRRSTQVMTDLEYEPRIPLIAIDAQKSAGEYAFRKRGSDALVEFHTERTFRYHPRPLLIEKLFQRRASVAIDGRDVPALSLEDELVLICVHGAKHFWERLMWIADVAALISAQQALDWNRAIAAACEAGAERILRLGLRLVSDIFAVPLPPHIETVVHSDRTVAKLATQIEKRLISSEPRKLGLMDRGIFRVRMCGGFFAGAAYLLRLSLSPTEEDWTPGNEHNRSVFRDAIGRPLRLAKKHSRHSKS